MMGIAGTPSLVHTPGPLHTKRGGKKRSKLGRAALYNKDLTAASVHSSGQLTMTRKPKKLFDEDDTISQINKAIYAKFNPNHDEKGRFGVGGGGGGSGGKKPRGTSGGASHASSLGGAVGATAGAYGGEALGALGGPLAPALVPTLGTLGGSLGDMVGRKIGTAIYNHYYSPPQEETPDTVGGELGAGAGASLGVSAAKHLISAATPWEGKVGADIAAEVIGTAYGEMAGTRFGNFVAQRFGGVASKMAEGVKGHALYEGAEFAGEHLLKPAAKLIKKAKQVPPGGQTLRDDKGDGRALSEAPAAGRFRDLLNQDENKARLAQVHMAGGRVENFQRKPSESFNSYRTRFQAASDAGVKPPFTFPMAKRRLLFED
jgi:hypothetical protein